MLRLYGGALHLTRVQRALASQRDRATLEASDLRRIGPAETAQLNRKVSVMSDAANRILEQLQAQNDLRMQAANDIAQAVAARVEAEQHLEQAKAAEKQAFTAALKKGWTQTELNKIDAPSRRRPRKKTSETTSAAES
ncbi:hypothetical protein AA310_01135 [Arthrobacter sp. YC-RL1]|nr:hypothetical protein ATC04_18030 [Arthrobacter sp. YC-RL1]KLI90561.1 hypothetical protein AA310_01135 [Arthrobacter sp. YC-RL1]